MVGVNKGNCSEALGKGVTWLTFHGCHWQIEGLVTLWLQGGALSSEGHCCNGPICLVCCDTIKPAQCHKAAESAAGDAFFTLITCLMSSKRWKDGSVCRQGLVVEILSTGFPEEVTGPLCPSFSWQSPVQAVHMLP